MPAAVARADDALEIEPMKKVAKMLRGHGVLLRNWFQARGQPCSGVVEVSTAKQNRLPENPSAFGCCVVQKSRCIIHLVFCPSLISPTDFAEESGLSARPARQSNGKVAW